MWQRHFVTWQAAFRDVASGISRCSKWHFVMWQVAFWQTRDAQAERVISAKTKNPSLREKVAKAEMKPR